MNNKQPTIILSLMISTLTACGGGSSSYSGDDNSNDNSADQDIVVEGQTSAPVTSNNNDLGDLFIDENELTLYIFEQDENGVSNCLNSCATIWPPLLASNQSVESKDFTTTTRENGDKQWSFKGYPLYLYSGDSNPGETNGQGLQNHWFVAQPDPVKHADSEEGPIIAANGSVPIGDQREDKTNFSLYTFELDEPGVSNCNGGCAAAWPPLLVETGEKASHPFSFITREDDSLQWALNEMPLYFYAGDTEPGATNGNGLSNGEWQLARVAPIKTSQHDSKGTIFVGHGHLVDADGASDDSRENHSLYTFDKDEINISQCLDDCFGAWPPLYAKDSDISYGDFTVIERIENGETKRQWALEGKPLYFYVGDSAEGDVNGDGLGEGENGSWHLAKPE